jgi:hypothetical protein
MGQTKKARLSLGQVSAGSSGSELGDSPTLRILFNYQSWAPLQAAQTFARKTPSHCL